MGRKGAGNCRIRENATVCSASPLPTMPRTTVIMANWRTTLSWWAVLIEVFMVPHPRFSRSEGVCARQRSLRLEL
ncbi:hypothetical protein PS639_04077 [Pseudomonas fluorescens]|nr:hypothetical protein PS639_04077 [Pseudomonas fluorescens]